MFLIYILFDFDVNNDRGVRANNGRLGFSLISRAKKSWRVERVGAPGILKSHARPHCHVVIILREKVFFSTQSFELTDIFYEHTYGRTEGQSYL